VRRFDRVRITCVVGYVENLLVVNWRERALRGNVWSRGPASMGNKIKKTVVSTTYNGEMTHRKQQK